VEIEIREIKTKAELKQFIKLPAEIHKQHINWVPPIYTDDKVFFNSKKNRLFNHCTTVLVLAYRNKRAVGRIMGIIHHEYNAIHKENDARFCFMECFNDKEVFHALIEYIEKWSTNKGITRLVGPLGFSDKDPQGFMIEGFNECIVISTNGNLPYMPEMMVNEGYTKKVDCVEYKIAVPDKIPAFYEAIYTRVTQKNNYKVLEFKERKKLKPYVRPVLQLLNESYSDIYAFAPFTESEMDDFANRYLLLLDPNFIKIVTDLQGNILSFIIGMPDIGKGIIAAKGKILPFGILKIIASRKKSKQLNLLLGAVKEEIRGQGLDVVMGVKMLESAHQRGIQTIDSHLVLETNTKMRMEYERMGGVVYKRYRIYKKEL
jgi:hypothetical protein